MNHLDAGTGRIRPGLLADLVVLDPDPFAIPAADLAGVRAAATFVSGEAVFRS